MKRLAPLLLVLVASCEEDIVGLPDQGVFSDAAYATATVQGYLWDPEAFWIALATCAPPGQKCPLPPLTLPGTPLFSASVVTGGFVGLFDPLQPMQVMPLPYAAAMPTDLEGGFNVMGVPLRSLPPFFMVAAVPPGAGGTVDAGMPPANYLPTFTMKPIGTGKTTLCLSQAAGAVSDSGALEAVAIYLTSRGTPTVVTDFLDPTKAGGVAVWWLWMPGPGQLKVPAFGAGMSADVGTTYTIGWLPPGLGPPFVTAIQSKRGFFVDTLAPDPMIPTPGLTVTVLPPLMGPPPNVTFTATDPVPDPTMGRPFTFPQLPPAPLAPGLISFGELQALTPGVTGAPPDWVCLP